MNEAKEISVTLKDDEKRMTHKFLVYEEVEVTDADHTLIKCIADARKSFDGEPDEIKVRITIQVR